MTMQVSKNVTTPLMSCLVPLSLAANCIRENVKYQEVQTKSGVADRPANQQTVNRLSQPCSQNRLKLHGTSQTPVSQPTYLSASSSYIWSLCSVCSHVLPASTTACSLISTNKFVLDTNYSFAVSGAVGQTNERQQSPHHRGLFVSRNSDRCGGRGRGNNGSSSHCWVKGGLFKGRRRRSKKKIKRIGGREERGRPGGIFFLALLRVEGSQEQVPQALVLHASLERRYVRVRICPPPAAAGLLQVPSSI